MSKHEKNNPTMPQEDPTNRNALNAPEAEPVEVRSQVPKWPFYLSRSAEVNWEWSNNYAEKLVTIGSKYGITPGQIETVTLNANALDATMLRIKQIDYLRAQWMMTRDALLNFAPADRNQPVEFPADPVFDKLPAARPAWILAMHVETAEIILKRTDLSQTDRNALRLLKAEGKPLPPNAKKRKKASDYNYPVIQFSVELGKVVIKITRGSKEMREQTVMIRVDKEGKGVYETVCIISTNEYEHLIVLPEGVKSSTWTYKAIYLLGTKEMSDWSPETPVLVIPMEKAND